MGLADRAGHFPNQLSGGQQQRVAIARALVTGAPLLLADEPTGNLDSRTSEEIMGLLVRMNEERGLTVVLVTHETDIAEYAKRVVVFRDGRIESDRLNHQRRRPTERPANAELDASDEDERAGARAAAGEPVSFFGLLRIAVKGFSRHRLRALLTTLGIMIGVGAFIAMVALGRGASERVAAQMAAMGSNVLGGARGRRLVRRRAGRRRAHPQRRRRGRHPQGGRRRPLRRARGVDQRPGGVGRRSTGRTQIRGTTPDYVHVRAWNIQRGAFFGQRDVETANKVCVLGQVVVDQLFGGEDPLGQTIRVRTMNCQVIGILARKGQGGMGQDYDDVVLMPITAVRRKLINAGGAQAQGVERIYLSATSGQDTVRAQAQVQELLRQRKRTREGDPDDPIVRDMTEFAEAAQEANKTMTLLLAGIAAVSLIVGGIGIMNIMLVSVTERTREIGIRMAVGAKGRHVLMQFLLEAVVLTMIGGLVGVGLGTGAAKLFSELMEWPTQLGAESYAIAVTFSTLVGVLFGFYPAWRASRPGSHRSSALRIGA